MGNMLKAMARARAKARENGCPYCVVEFDEGEGRRIAIVKASYTLSDEFEAFCGEILYSTEE